MENTSSVYSNNPSPNSNKHGRFVDFNNPHSLHDRCCGFVDFELMYWGKVLGVDLSTFYSHLVSELVEIIVVTRASFKSCLLSL